MDAVRTSLVAVLAILMCAATAPAEDNAEEVFRSLYGERVKQALASPDKADDLDLARRLLDAARSSEDQPQLLALLCENAAGLAGKLPEGQALAIEAMEFLAQAAPEKKESAQERIVNLRQSRYNAAQGYARTEAAESFIQALLAAAQTKCDLLKCGEAVEMASRAYQLAAVASPTRKEEAQAKLRQFQDREKAVSRVRQLERRLKGDPSDGVARDSLIRAYLVDLDSPRRAAELLTADCDERYRTYVPLAAKEPGDVAEAARLELAEFYRSLAVQDSPQAKASMLLRAVSYYEAFLTTHKAADASGLKAKLTAEEIRKDLAKMGVGEEGALRAIQVKLRQMSADILAFAAKRKDLPPEKQLDATLAKLKELHGGKEFSYEQNRTEIRDGKLVSLDLSARHTWVGQEHFMSNQDLASIDPLYGLPLERLYLRECRNLKGDLAALAGMKLTALDLWDCRGVTNLDGIQGMPLQTLVLPSLRGYQGDLSFLAGMKLTSLTVRDCGIGSLNGIQGMKLSFLHLDGLPNLPNLNGIQGMPLESLIIHNLDRLRGDLAGLNQMGLKKLTALNITWCGGLMSLNGIQGLPLQRLSLAGCSGLRGDLSMLKGMELTFLDIGSCDKLTSLSGIQGMKLKTLHLARTGLVDLDGIQGQQLTRLNLNGCGNLQSLRGLEGMPLDRLSAVGCERLADISALRGSKLAELTLDGCKKLANLNGLQDLPLVGVSLRGCDSLGDREYLLLSRIPNLTTVDTGLKARDDQILALCKKLRDQQAGAKP